MTSSTIVTDTFISLAETATLLALIDGEGLLTADEQKCLDTVLGAISEMWPDYLDEFYPDPDDGDDCFTDEYGWSPEDE